MSQRKRTQEPTRRKDALPLVAAAILVAANLCLFGPFEIYLPNQAEVDSTFRDVLPLLLGFGAAAAILLAGVGIVLPRPARRVYGVIMFVVGVLLWIEGSFLKWGYGELDGRGIDWSRFTWQGWVDSAIWIGLLAGAIVIRRRLFRHVLFIALGFVVLQTAFALVRAQRSPSPPARSPAAADEETLPPALARVSKDRNIFHIIMDSFQTDVFLELVEEDGLAGQLDGFVVYENNLSVGKRTVLCVPAIFSGEIYDGTMAESEYFRAAIQRSFHHLLLDNGWAVNLMPHVTMENTRYTRYFHTPATYATPRATRLLRTSSFLVDVSMFRQLPHHAKRFIFNDESWRFSSFIGDPPTHTSFHHKAFFRDYIDKMAASNSRPSYQFIHLMPPHPPFVTTADGRYAGEALPNTRENYKNEARYVLRVFMQFIAKLKDMGLYDSSIIILQGDHGAGYAPPASGEASSKLANRVSALLALKPASARAPLTTSTAPSTIADIPATIMDLVQLEHSYAGESLLRLDAAAEREREVVFVSDRSKRTPVMHRWIVRGSVSDTTSWQEIPPLTIERRVRSYRWGQRVGFGITGSGGPYLTEGWSTTSPTIHWSDGSASELTFAVVPPELDVRVRITFFPHIVPGKVDQQRILVRINGMNAGAANCTEKKSFKMELTIKRAALQSDLLVISFEFPDAVSPLEIGSGRDPRKLAMGIYSFETELLKDQ